MSTRSISIPPSCRVIVSVLLLALSGCASWSTLPSTDSRQELAAATEQWAAAFSKGDLAALTSMYGKDAVVWGTSSSTMRKDPPAIREYYAQLLKAFPETKVSIGEMSIRVYGDSGINSGLLTIHRASRDGGLSATPARFSMMYVRRDGKWLIVDHHSSLATP